MKEITLKWNHYYYPEINKNAYKLYYNDNGNPLATSKYTQNDSVIKINLQTLESIMQKDSTIKFQILRNSVDGISSSNTVVYKIPNLKKGPSFIVATGTTMWDSKKELLSADELKELSKTAPNKVTLNFYVGPQSELEKYIISRSTIDGSIGWSSLDTITGGPELSYEDQIDTLGKYYYKMEALDTCNIKIFFPDAIESTIPLTHTKSGAEVKLTWKPYSRFDGKQEYCVYRLRADKKAEQIACNIQGTSYSDNLDDFDKGVMEVIGYFVDIVPENNLHNSNGHAVSNLACITIMDEIKLPKSLILGPSCSPVINENYTFRPSGVADPLEFYLAVTDRWGTKVWETTNIEKGWNGTYLSNGEVVPQGGYIYYCKYVGPDKVPHESYGTVPVICP
jgi:hypothetical protein